MATLVWSANIHAQNIKRMNLSPKPFRLLTSSGLPKQNIYSTVRPQTQPARPALPARRIDLKLLCRSWERSFEYKNEKPFVVYRPMGSAKFPPKPNPTLGHAGSRFLSIFGEDGAFKELYYQALSTSFSVTGESMTMPARWLAAYGTWGLTRIDRYGNKLDHSHLVMSLVRTRSGFALPDAKIAQIVSLNRDLLAFRWAYEKGGCCYGKKK